MILSENPNAFSWTNFSIIRSTGPNQSVEDTSPHSSENRLLFVYLFDVTRWCFLQRHTVCPGQNMNPILMLWAITKKQERPNVFIELLNHIKYIQLVFEPYKMYLFYPLMNIKIHLVFWVLLCLPLCGLLRNIISSCTVCSRVTCLFWDPLSIFKTSGDRA